jgi:LysM repeat protein
VRKLLPFTLLAIIGLFLIPAPAYAQTSSQASAQELINAVNELRIANGLHTLNPHPALMEVAQWEANAIASGAPGHVRPPGLTLGQWLISLGYPLAGDLSLDGYRSENWVSAQSVEQAIQFWLGDGPHTNTMLSPNRSDIGAAIVGDIYVLETALQTNSGEMQTDAKDLLTALPYDETTGNLTSDYILPVIVSTARADGDVVHKVGYGQSLWSIAIAYHTTIDQIRLWNNLGENESVYEGEVLLVQKASTQPVDTLVPELATATPILSAPPAISTATLHPTVTSTASPTSLPEAEKEKTSSGRGWLVVFFILVLVVGAWLAMSIRVPESSQ